jgi:hypothetical protein
MAFSLVRGVKPGVLKSMRNAYVSLILAAGLAAAGSTAAWAQAPAVAPPPPPPPPAAATPAPAAPSTTAPSAAAPSTTAPSATTPPPSAAPAAPATTPPATAPEAPVTAADQPTLPASGDGAVIITILEKVCVPLVRGGSLDQLAPQVPGMKKNRRDSTWTMPLGGDKNYTLTVLPQGVNKDVCLAEVHFAIGQDAPIVKAVNIWSFLHKPELILQANYVATDADGVKRVRKSWEHLESASSTAVNFTTWRKPDDSPLNRSYDTGQLYYQERKF